MGTQNNAGGAPAQQNAPTPINAIAEAQKEIQGFERDIISGLTAGDKLHEIVAFAMFLEPDSAEKLAAKAKGLGRFTGQFADTRKFIGALQSSQKGASSEAKRVLTNKLGHAARNASYILHHLAGKSDAGKDRLRKNPDALRDDIKGIKLSEAKAKFEKDNLPPNTNDGSEDGDPQEALNQMLAGNRILSDLATQAYLGPEGNIVPALIRVNKPGSFDLVSSFPLGREKLAFGLGATILQTHPDNDRVGCEALLDILRLRRDFFKPIKTQELVKADEPDGNKWEYHAQTGIAGGGAEVLLGYAKCNALPFLHLTPALRLPAENGTPGLLNVQMTNAAVKAGLLKADIRRHLVLSSKLDDEHIRYGFVFSRSDKSEWEKLINVAPLTPDHARDPSMPDLHAFNPVSSAIVSHNAMMKVWCEDIERFRGSGHTKSGSHSPKLTFSPKGVAFTNFEQKDVLLPGTADQKSKPSSVSMAAKHFLTAIDCIMTIARGGDVEFSTDGTGLICLTVKNAIGAYRMFLPVIPSGKKEPTAEGYRLMSAVYAPAKAA